MLEDLSTMESTKIIRGTKQPEMPAVFSGDLKAGYSIYPSFSIAEGLISSGYSSLADWMVSRKTVCVDGYVAVDWDGIKASLEKEFAERSIRVNWIDTKDFLKPEAELDKMVEPFMGTDDSVWGKVCDLSLADFFLMDDLKNLEAQKEFDLNIVWGIGASFVSSFDSIAYFDIPKNELLFRVRGKSAFNIGSNTRFNMKNTYKRLYFVDWIVLNAYKKEILPRIDLFADTQWLDTLNWIKAEDLRNSLTAMCKTVFRPRPWFDPGVWGGQWMKERFHELAQDEVNYAWSFEIIAPENGLVLESSGKLLEISFDTLMFQESKNILGSGHQQFGDYFPIRFDFLDTFDGGNLSVQCHPALDYIQENFGEQFTQDETYYIMDCKDNAKVYLGFQEGIEPNSFRKALEQSVAEEKELDVTQYVQEFDSEKHKLYLIPNQTVHSAGKNNLVLEISATPYIYTFKMYDWLQRDKEGKPRPINIEHGFKNLDFSRQGEKVEQDHISKPYVLEERDGAKIIQYPTHPVHYYEIQRFDIQEEIEVKTMNKAHVLMLVEGSSIELEDRQGNKQIFYYAETFIVPASAESYKIKNLGNEEAKVILSFLK